MLVQIINQLRNLHITQQVIKQILSFIPLQQLVELGATTQDLIEIFKTNKPIEYEILNDIDLLDEIAQSLIESQRVIDENTELPFFITHPTIFEFYLITYPDEMCIALQHVSSWQRYAISYEFPEYTHFGSMKSMIAYFGRLDLLNLLFKYMPDLVNDNDQDNQLYFAAALMGHEDIILFLLKTGAFFDSDVLDGAAFGGHLEVLKILQKNKPDFGSTCAIDDAAMNGHFEVVKFLQKKRTEGCTAKAIDSASQNGHLEIVKFLYRCQFECTQQAMNLAAEGGHLAILQFLHKNGETCTTAAMDLAARHGYFNIVRFLHENRNEGCTTNAMNKAAANGHFTIVKFLHKSRTEGCTKLALDLAALNGHFEIVQYLNTNRSEGCTTRALNGAAENGHLEIVKYLHERRFEGCTFVAVDAAADRGHFDIVKFLLTNRLEGYSENAITKAKANGHFKIVELLAYFSHLLDVSIDFTTVSPILSPSPLKRKFEFVV